MTSSKSPHPYNVIVPTANVQQTMTYETETGTSKVSYLLKIRKTATIQIVCGFLLVFYGFVSIILLGRWSYFATPIWTGLLIFCLTGSIGRMAASTGKHCLVGGYIAMSIVAILTSFALMEVYVFAAILETGAEYDYIGYSWYCQPGTEGSLIINCTTSEAARKTFDALIAVTGAFLFVLCIVSASFGCCANCTGCGICCKNGCDSCCTECCGKGGCGNCCAPPQTPTTAIYVGNGAAVSNRTDALPEGAVHFASQPGVFIVQNDPAAANPPPVGALPGQQVFQPTLYIGTNNLPASLLPTQQHQHQQQQQQQERNNSTVVIGQAPDIFKAMPPVQEPVHNEYTVI